MYEFNVKLNGALRSSGQRNVGEIVREVCNIINNLGFLIIWKYDLDKNPVQSPIVLIVRQQ